MIDHEQVSRRKSKKKKTHCLTKMKQAKTVTKIPRLQFENVTIGERAISDWVSMKACKRSEFAIKAQSYRLPQASAGADTRQCLFQLVYKGKRR